MNEEPILLIGGTGQIGRLTAHALRAAQPNIPLLIGSRDRERSAEAAAAIGRAKGVVIDPHASDLGLGDLRVSAVAVFYSDARLASLQYAQERAIPHLGISSGIYEIAPEVATFMHRPDAAPVVLGYEWLVGATTIAVLTCARLFGRVDDIRIGALVDELDGGGPAVEEDFERLTRMMPAALTRRDGDWIWRGGKDAAAGFQMIDGTWIEGSGFSSIDVVGLAAATGAPNVQFNLATGISSSRRRGQGKSTEIIIELAGEDRQGRSLRTRHAVFHPGGAAPLTALGVSMTLERLTGIDGAPATTPGLYFPYQVIDHEKYLTRLSSEGGSLLRLAG